MDAEPEPSHVRFVAKITARGCITLSPEVREVLGLSSGDIVELEVRQAAMAGHLLPPRNR